MVAAFHSSLPPNKVPRYIQNAWDRWIAYCKPFGPPELLLKKGIDRTGRQRPWDRMLPETTLSTTGLLAVLLGQVEKCTNPEPRWVEQVMQSFLADQLRGVSSELEIPFERDLAEAYSAAGSIVEEHLTEVVEMEGARVKVLPLFG